MKKKLCITFFFLSLMFLLTACGTTEIDMNEYVDFTFSGYEYLGSATSEVDVRKMLLDNEECFGFDRKALKSGDGEDVLEDLEDAFKVKLDKKDGYKNDDKLAYSWNVDEDILEDIAEEYKVVFLYTDADVKVSGLDPLEDIDLLDDLYIEFYGRNGEGYLSYVDCYDYNWGYLDDELELSKTENLSNGDVVTVSLSEDLIQQYRQMGYNPNPTSKDIIVDNLTVPQVVDAFSGIEVEFSGNSPYVSVDVYIWNADYYYNFDYSYDTDGYFANGDTFEITLTESSIDYALDYYDLIPEATRKTYTINQPVLITEISDLTADDVANLYATYETSLGDTITDDWDDPTTLRSITAIGHSVAVEDTSSYYYSYTPSTRVTTYYKVDVAPRDAEAFSFYYYVQHENLCKTTNGELVSENDVTPYGYKEYDWWYGDYYPYGDCFERDGLYYVGFETMEEMFEDTLYYEQNSSYWMVDYVLNDAATAEPEDEPVIAEPDTTTPDADIAIDYESRSYDEHMAHYRQDFQSSDEYVDGYYLLDGYAYRIDDNYDGFYYGYFDANGTFQQVDYISFYEGGY